LQFMTPSGHCSGSISLPLWLSIWLPCAAMIQEENMRRREFIEAAGAAVSRREVFALLAGAGITLAGRTPAQPGQKLPVVGFLHPGMPESGSPAFDVLREGLRDVGYVEGETIKVEARWARGRPEMLPRLTQELVQLPVDVLVATARPS